MAVVAALKQVESDVVECTRCPELREYCAAVAREKRKAYADHDYWGRPVPSFGDRRAGLLIVGLAPGAHGANRTGRMFTGDRSGDFLYAALHRAGFANQAEATDRADGLALTGAYITAAAHCAPPANKPTAAQLDACRPYLGREIAAMDPVVTLCLGGISWTAAWRAWGESGADLPRPRTKFGHGIEVGFATSTGRRAWLLGSYHVSQQNTFTGRLTSDMLDAVLATARGRLGSGRKS